MSDVPEKRSRPPRRTIADTIAKGVQSGPKLGKAVGRRTTEMGYCKCRRRLERDVDKSTSTWFGLFNPTGSSKDIRSLPPQICARSRIILHYAHCPTCYPTRSGQPCGASLQTKPSGFFTQPTNLPSNEAFIKPMEKYGACIYASTVAAAQNQRRIVMWCIVSIKAAAIAAALTRQQW